MGNNWVSIVMDFLVEASSVYLMPFMLFGFALAVAFRLLTYYTIRREFYFIKEFSKKAGDYYSPGNQNDKDPSFYNVVKALLLMAYKNVFTGRRHKMRRNHDYVLSLSDRVFMVHIGTEKFVKDTLGFVKYKDKRSFEDPKMLDLSRSVFETNPVFNRILGLFPIHLVHDALNILPGLFIVGGIFGTFLGIMKALPGLGAMDLADAATTKATMDMFLGKISFAMSTSIFGIIMSVGLTTLNTMFSAENLYYKAVTNFAITLDKVWNECENNDFEEVEIVFPGRNTTDPNADFHGERANIPEELKRSMDDDRRAS